MRRGRELAKIARNPTSPNRIGQLFPRDGAAHEWRVRIPKILPHNHSKAADGKYSPKG